MGLLGLGSLGVGCCLLGVLSGLLLSTYYEPPSRSADPNRTIIAIDLGNTHSSVGIYNNGKVQVIPGLKDNLVMPSFVCFLQDGQLLFGEEAQSQQHSNPQNTIYGAKRLLGRSWHDPVVQKHIKSVPYLIINKDDKPYIEVEVTDEIKVFSPEQICGIIVKKLKERAEEYLGKAVSDTVVSMPSLANNAQRESTKEVCSEAGLEVKRIVPNPTAAAIAYGVEKQNKGKTKAGQKILVFGLGFSSLDLSVVNIKDGVIEVLATGGNTEIGGDEFTARIALHLGFEEDSQMLAKELYQEAEQAKIALSSLDEVRVIKYIDDADVYIDVDELLTRATFEQINSGHFKAIMEAVSQVLQDSKLTKSDIDDVILTGGSTYIPKIKELLKDFFNGKDPIRVKHDDNAVLHGVSIQAGKLNNEEEVSDLQVYDVTPLTLGVRVNHGLMSPVIKHNTKMPAKVTEQFHTAADNITEVTIRIFEGERAMASDNNLLGTFHLSGIPSDLRGEQRLNITFNVDINGILHVSGKVLSTGSNNEITVTKYKKSRSTEEVSKMLKDGEDFSDKDKATRKRLHALREYEDTVYSTRNLLLYKDKGLVTDSQREKIEKLVNENLEWLEENSDETSETFAERHKRFQALILELRKT